MSIGSGGSKEIASGLPPEIDLSQIISSTETRKVESSIELRHRQEKEILQLKHNFRKDWFILSVFTLLTSAILISSIVFCLDIQKNVAASEDLKKAALAAAFSLWTAAISGTLGYLAGKSKSGGESS
jgi:hypothetical protein